MNATGDRVVDRPAYARLDGQCPRPADGAAAGPVELIGHGQGLASCNGKRTAGQIDNAGKDGVAGEGEAAAGDLERIVDGQRQRSDRVHAAVEHDSVVSEQIDEHIVGHYRQLIGRPVERVRPQEVAEAVVETDGGGTGDAAELQQVARPRRGREIKRQSLGREVVGARRRGQDHELIAGISRKPIDWICHQLAAQGRCSRHRKHVELTGGRALQIDRERAVRALGVITGDAQSAGRRGEGAWRDRAVVVGDCAAADVDRAGTAQYAARIDGETTDTVEDRAVGDFQVSGKGVSAADVGDRAIGNVEVAVGI